MHKMTSEEDEEQPKLDVILSNSHKRYNSVNNRTIVNYEQEYNNHLNADIHIRGTFFLLSPFHIRFLFLKVWNYEFKSENVMMTEKIQTFLEILIFEI